MRMGTEDFQQPDPQNIEIRQWQQISNPKSNSIAVMDTGIANRHVWNLFEKTFPQLSNYFPRELSHEELLEAATYFVRDPIKVLHPRAKQSASQAASTSLSIYSPTSCNFFPHFKPQRSDLMNKSKCLAHHYKAGPTSCNALTVASFQCFCDAPARIKRGINSSDSHPTIGGGNHRRGTRGGTKRFQPKADPIAKQVPKKTMPPPKVPTAPKTTSKQPDKAVAKQKDKAPAAPKCPCPSESPIAIATPDLV